jgi:hypothetical protein
VRTWIVGGLFSLMARVVVVVVAAAAMVVVVWSCWSWQRWW